MQNKIEFIESYLTWVNDNKLDPPTFSPEEYAVHLRNISNEKLIDAMVVLVNQNEDADKIIEAMMIALGDMR
jgi:hypothetical protein